MCKLFRETLNISHVNVISHMKFMTGMLADATTQMVKPAGQSSHPTHNTVREGRHLCSGGDGIEP